MHIYNRTVIYYCHQNGEVARESFENAEKSFDRRGHLSAYKETVPTADGKTYYIIRTFYPGGQLRSEGNFGSHRDMPQDNVTYYYEDGRIWQEWTIEQYKFRAAKIYDRQGQVIEHVTGDDMAIRMAFAMQFEQESIENKLKDMAIASEQYAQEHGGQYYPETPSSKNMVSGYKYDHTFDDCIGTWPASYIHCTNGTSGYEYKYVPDDKKPSLLQKVLTIKTSEEFSIKDVDH